MGSIFSPPKPKKPPGPSKASLDLQAAQAKALKRQSETLDREEAEAKKKKGARDRVISATRGKRSGLGTLFAETGASGFSKTLGG